MTAMQFAPSSHGGTFAQCKTILARRQVHIAAQHTHIIAASNSTAVAKKVVVIGAGCGGLVSAGLLAKAGLDVTLLEKNETVGGRMQSATLCDDKGEYRFDTGPSLLLFPDKYFEAFNSLDMSLEQMVELRKVQPQAYRVFFQGHSNQGTPWQYIDLLNDIDAMAEQVEKWERGAGEMYRRFIAMARRHLELGVPYFIDRDFTELKDAAGLADLLPALPSINPWQLLGPHDLVMRSFFKDARLRAMTTFQDLYVGLSPQKAPAVFSLLAGTELTDGVLYPVGGFQKIRDALLQAVQKSGVKVHTLSSVSSITVTNNNSSSKSESINIVSNNGNEFSVTSVTLENGQEIFCDLIVCNRDLPAAYELIKSSPNIDSSSPSDNSSSTSNVDNKDFSIEEYAERCSQQLSRKKYSSGVIAYNWCVNTKLDMLSHHNTFLSDDFKGSWELATSATQIKERMNNFYVHCPSKTDSSAAPEGCESVMVLLPVASMQHDPPGSSDEDCYSDMIAAGKEKILQAFIDCGVGNLLDGNHITNEMIIAPPQWEARYGLKFGAAFGLSHALDQLSLFRPSNKDSQINGLYFVGASTRPGNGVPLCFISGKLTAQRVLKDLNIM